MANVFDQFDAAPAKANVFDQFDAPPPAAPGITLDNVVRSVARGIPGVDKFAAGMDALTHPVLGRGAEAPTLGERYHANLEHERGIDRAYDEAHPVASVAAQLAGGTAALAPLAGAAAGRTLLGMGGATLPGAMARSAASGAGMGAAGRYIENEGWGNTEGMAGSGALGGALGAAGPLVGRAAGAIVNRVRGTTRAAVPPTAQELIDTGSHGFDAARASGLELHGQAVSDISHRLEQNILPNVRPVQAPQSFDILHSLQNNPPGGTVDATALMAARSQLGNAARNHVNPTERVAAGPSIEGLENYLSSVPAADVARGDPAAFIANYAPARLNYAAGKRAERAAEVQRYAETSAASTGSGNNETNKVRQGWNQVLRQEAKKKGSTGLEEPELAQADKVARGTGFGNTMRLTSNVLGGGGGMGRLHASGLGAAAGGLIGGPAGAFLGGLVAPGVGAAARYAARRSTERGARTLDEMIRRRAPASAAANAAEAQRIGTNEAMTHAGAFGSRAATTPIAQMLQQLYGQD